MAIYKNSYPFGSIVRSGLVLSLDATNYASYPGNGNVWYDTSGNGNNGTFVSGAYNDMVRGRSSVVFDGVNDYVNIPYSSNFNLSSWTLSSWFKLTATPDQYDAVVARGLDTNNINYIIDCDTTYFRGGSYKASPFLSYIVSSTTTVSSRIGLWTNIAVYMTPASRVGLFINGVKEIETLFGSADFSSTSPNSTINIGALNLNGSMGRFCPIQVASTQLYNRALSSDEVLQNYNALKSRFGL